MPDQDDIPELLLGTLDSLQSIPAVALDADGRLVFYTRAFERLVGWDPSERLGKRPPHPWWPREEVGKSEGWMSFFLTGAAARSRFRGVRMALVRADGERVTVVAEYQPLVGGDGTPLFHLLTMTPERPSEASSEIDSAAVEKALQSVRLSLDHLAGRLGMPEGGSERAQPPEFAALSRRERDVLELLLEGLPPREIAKRLFISRHTVRNHTTSIYRKLQVHSQVELLRRFGSR